MARTLATALLVTLAVVTISAQPSGFTGRWRVNNAAGDPPSASNVEHVWDIAHTPSQLEVKLIVRGREIRTQVWPLDGRSVPTAWGDMEMETTAIYSNGLIVISGKTMTPAGEADIKEYWFIDPATKALRVARVRRTIGSTFSRRLLLERIAEP